jgi:HPt (histidine-containing phosphotransfer) domain-containing protein
LPLTVAAFDAALRVDDLKQAAMHMHTAKGNAGTLGLHALAELTGALEKWCAKPEGHAADEAQTEPLVSSLESVVQSSLVDLQHAIAVLEEALAHDTSATPAAAAALGTPDAAALRSALTELETLLANSDLTALERFADLRPVFSGLPQAQLEALEEALQNLELEQAHALCVAALQLL